jgi:tRNA splicing ligase
MSMVDRSISDKLKKRLQAQAQEAQVMGLEKTASMIESNLEAAAERSDDDYYTYSIEELQADVEKLMYAATIRVQDYFDKTADAREVAYMAESYANDLIDGVRHSIGGKVLGPYEPQVPGEVRERTSIEVGEDETE